MTYVAADKSAMTGAFRRFSGSKVLKDLAKVQIFGFL
jgi:hypothetical protein